MTEKDWSSRLLESSYLTAYQKQQVRETAYVTLVSLADYGVRWDGDPRSAARSLDLLQRAEAFHQPTRAFYFVRGQCRRLQGDTSAAAEDEKQFKAAAARTAWDYFLPGHTAGWGGDLDEAIRSCQAALRMQPNHFNSLFFLAYAFNTDKINRRPEAVQLFTACIALRPDHAVSYGNRAGCYIHLGQLDDAIADSRQAIRLKPDLAWAHGNLGHALRKQGKLDEAIAAYREASRLGPADHADHHSNLGHSLVTQGKLDEANAAFREAIRLQPLSVDGHHFLGHSLVTQGKLDEAVAAFREAIRLKPGLADVHNDLAWLLATCADAKIRDFPKAVALARRAVELAPKVEGYWNTLGVAHYRAGDWKASVAALEKSMELGHGGGAIDWFFVAMAHWRLGHGDEARTWYEKAAAWMEKNQPKDEEHIRFRAEASALVGLTDRPAEVLARP